MEVTYPCTVCTDAFICSVPVSPVVFGQSDSTVRDLLCFVSKLNCKTRPLVFVEELPRPYAGCSAHCTSLGLTGFIALHVFITRRAAMVGYGPTGVVLRHLNATCAVGVSSPSLLISSSAVLHECKPHALVPLGA